MENLKHLLPAILAVTLTFYVVSGISPNSFTGLNAFADDDNEDNDQNSGTSGSDDNSDDDQSDNNTNSTDDGVDSEEHGNQTNSHGGDDEQSENKSSNSTNHGTKDEDNEYGANSGDEKEHAQEYDSHQGSKIHVDDHGVEIKVEMSINMTDGAYSVNFSCETPSVNQTLESMFKVEDNEGKLDAKINLGNDTYSGCELVLVGTNTVIASFDSFTVQEDTEDKDSNEKHQERRHEIVSKTTGHEIHKRHLSANPSSPGDYMPGWNYTLMADGTAKNGTNSAANATVSVDVAVWKSTHTIVLLDITGGTIEIGGHEYDVRIGYALYSTEHGVMRLGALVSDDSDSILKLKLYGNASEGAELPMQTGQSIDMSFDSNPSGNGLEGWALTLEGTVKAV